MRLWARWSPFHSQPALTRRRAWPILQSLEDRTLMAAGLCAATGMNTGGASNSLVQEFRSGGGSSSGPATQLEVTVPENVQAGQGFDMLVEAVDASNRPATDYTGTVHFTLGTTDSSATLPADYTFTAADHGFHLFHVTLAATGSQTLTVTDTTTGSITGSAVTTVNPAPVATRLLVLTQRSATTGEPTSVTVVALDAAGHRVSDYTGTVALTNSDASATLPAAYTFTASDHGRHTFQVTFRTTGSQTVTATDTATSSITGQASLTVAAAGVVTHFGVITLGRSLPGFATPVLVVALDASNHVVTDYTGTVHFTSSDSQATLPADYTFQASDNGSHLFSVTFNTTGRQTLTVTDTASSSTTGRVNVGVTTRQRWLDALFSSLGGSRPGTKFSWTL
jgi:hypothetical protein